MHDAAAAPAYFPGGHMAPFRFVPTIEQKRPAQQARHERLPKPPLNWPGAHLVHSMAAGPGEEVPARHWLQSLPPENIWNLPGGHRSHVIRLPALAA